MGFSSSDEDTYSARSEGFRFPIQFRRFSLSQRPSPVVLGHRRDLSHPICSKEITSLMSLKPFKYSYRICVRICRTWRAIRYGAEDYNGLHCVMGASIHGFLPEEQVEDMIERPRQGQMYEIHQFSTKQHVYGLKPVNNPVVVQFNGRTIF